MYYRKLDKRSPIPLYYQLVEWIRQEIDIGNLIPDMQLPSERELGERMGISRVTVRQAIMYLESEGILHVKPGIGTFVAQPKLTHNALNLLGFTEEMIQQGETVTSEVLEQSVVQPPPQVAAKLDLSTGEETVRIVRLRYVDQVPLLLETSFVPIALCPSLANEDLSTKSLYTLMEQEYGIHLQRSSQTIEVTVISEYERTLFGIESNMGMFLLEGVTFRGSGRPVEYFKALYRGDRFKLIVESQRDDLDVPANSQPVRLILTPNGR